MSSIASHLTPARLAFVWGQRALRAHQSRPLFLHPAVVSAHHPRAEKVLFVDPRFAAEHEPTPWFQVSTGGAR